MPPRTTTAPAAEADVTRRAAAAEPEATGEVDRRAAGDAVERAGGDGRGQAGGADDGGRAHGVEAERRERRAKVARLREAGVDPYPRRFPGRVAIGQVREAHDPAALPPGEHPDHRYRIAGRLVARRSHGRAAFVDIRDRSGELQAYARQEALGEEAWKRFQQLDVGDVVGVEGSLYVTRRGELSLRASSLRLLAKALRPPPDRYHGVQRPEVRSRQRELDLLANARSRQIFALRTRLVRALRDWMRERGFAELETPVLQRLAGGAAARPFRTRHNALGRTLSLRTATELYLKRAIVGGFEDVFELGRCFRNEGASREHSPEFTMLEWFQAYADYTDVMGLCERLVAEVAERALGTTTIEREGHEIDLAPPWPRLSLREALLERAGVDILTAGEERLAGLVGGGVQPGADWAWLVNALQAKLVEPTLIQPTFLVDLPLELWPLVDACPGKPRLGQAFDAIVAGLEIAGGGSDINDPEEQHARLTGQRERLQPDDGGGDDDDHLPHPRDHDYIRALEHGMLPASGAGLGVDRLAMLLTGADSIRAVTLFPA